MLFIQEFAYIPRGIVRYDLAAIHNDSPVRIGKNILQTMLRNDNCGAQLPIDLPHSIQKIRSSDWVQLTGRLVQNQHLRLHRHNGGQIQ